MIFIFVISRYARVLLMRKLELFCYDTIIVLYLLAKLLNSLIDAISRRDIIISISIYIFDIINYSIIIVMQFLAFVQRLATI